MFDSENITRLVFTKNQTSTFPVVFLVGYLAGVMGGKYVRSTIFTTDIPLCL
jgi:hypothetical protein